MVMGQRLASADLITYFVLCQHLIQWLNFVFNKASSFQHTTLVLFNFSLHAQVVSGAAALWRNWKRECENSATCLYIKIIFLLLFWSNTSVKCETSFCCKPSSSLFVLSYSHSTLFKPPFSFSILTKIISVPLHGIKPGVGAGGLTFWSPFLIRFNHSC